MSREGDGSPATPKSPTVRLSAMMVLMYAVQGAWWPLMAVHLKDLGVAGPRRGWIFACQALGTILVSLGFGRLVDRFWPTQKVLAVIFGAGTFALGLVASGRVTSAGGLFLLFFLYWLVTAPVYALSNSLAFRHLVHPGAEFGRVRLWGTAGWMMSGWVVTGVMLISGSLAAGRGAFDAFWVSTAASAIFACYALTLPNTPPVPTERSNVSTRTAVRSLLAKPGMVVYLITAFGVFLTTPFVFQVMPTYLESKGLPRAWTATVMTIGQWPEIAGLALLPWMLNRLGYKMTIGAGMLCWLVRFATLYLDPPLWLAVGGTLLHGFGVACVSVGGQVYVDQCAPSEWRATAQALNMSVTAGFGAFLGSLFAGSSVGAGADASGVFLIPCLIQGGLIIFFGMAFPQRFAAASREHATATGRRPRDVARSVPTSLGILAMEPADG